MLLKNALLYGGCVASTWIVAPGSAVAQTQAGRVEEIIVPAARADEKLPTTPVAVTAISAEIGRASCRESVCQYGWISVVAVSVQKNIELSTYIIKQTEQ